MDMRRLPHFLMRDIVSATRGILSGAAGHEIVDGVSTDSRCIEPGNLFVALKGETYDGHEYADESVKKGASAILIQKDRNDIIGRLHKPVAVVMVDDTLEALGDIARFWRSQFSVPVIAVTGSAGKTTTKDMIAAIMERTIKVLKSRGNFNNLVGLPLSLLEMRNDHDAAIVEMGTNHPGEIRTLAAIARPTVGVVINVGPAHLEGFGTIDAIGEEKSSLLFSLATDGTAIVNADDEVLGKFTRGLRRRVVTFGIKHAADVRAHAIAVRGAEGMRFSLAIGGAIREVDIPVVGFHNVYNALAAVAAASTMGADSDDVCEGLAGFTPPSGRMTVMLLKNGVYLVDDSYNANPVSMKEALETLSSLQGQSSVYVIMGDMLELGGQGETLHEEIGELCGSMGVRKLFCYGEYSPAVARGARKAGMTEIEFIGAIEPDTVAAELTAYTRRGDWILIKGSRKMRMERYVGSLIRKIGIDESRDD